MSDASSFYFIIVLFVQKYNIALLRFVNLSIFVSENLNKKKYGKNMAMVWQKG